MNIDFGRLDETGKLQIMRGKEWKSQVCMHYPGKCGDHCPLFGEPYKDSVVGATILRICSQRALWFQNFNDGRGKT